MSGKIVSLETAYRGWNALYVAMVQLEDGALIKRVIEDHGPAASVLAYDPARKCALLVRQLRVPILHASGQTSVLEAIAGGTDGGGAREAAEREAMEEAGVRLSALDHIADVWSMPGVSTERIALYLAEYGAADRIAAGGGLDEEHENIEVVEMPLAGLAAMARRGAIDDLKTLALLQALMLRRPELF